MNNKKIDEFLANYCSSVVATNNDELIQINNYITGLIKQLERLIQYIEREGDGSFSITKEDLTACCQMIDFVEFCAKQFKKSKEITLLKKRAEKRLKELEELEQAEV